MKQKKVKALCIKQYIDEESLEDYNAGKISFKELIHYEKGHEYLVIKDRFNRDYFVPSLDIDKKEILKDATKNTLTIGDNSPLQKAVFQAMQTYAEQLIKHCL